MVDVDLSYLAEVVFVRFLHCKVTVSHFPSWPLWKEVSMRRVYFRSGRYAVFPWGQNIYIDYLEICTGRCLFNKLYSLICLFINYLCSCLFSNLYQYGLTGICTLSCNSNTALFILLPKLFHLWPFSCLLCPFNIALCYWGVTGSADRARKGVCMSVYTSL